MVKIYLNTDGKLVVDRNNVKRMPSSVAHFPIFDENRQTLEIYDILSETELSNIVKENNSLYSSFDELEGVVLDFFVKASLSHVGLDIDEGAFTNLDNANEWYEINGTVVISPTPVGFDVIDDNLTYIGCNDVSHLFTGSSDVKVSKNAVLTYGLFINDEMTPRGVSVHTFSTPNAYELMAISKYIELRNGDVIRVKAKSDIANTVMTPTSLSLTLTGVK